MNFFFLPSPVQPLRKRHAQKTLVPPADAALHLPRDRPQLPQALAAVLKDRCQRLEQHRLTYPRVRPIQLFGKPSCGPTQLGVLW